MPELVSECTPAPATPPVPSSPPPTTPPEEPPAIPPIIDPDRFEDFPAFRETFLLYVPDPTANATLRGLGKLLYSLIMEYWGYWPDHPEGLFRASLRAAIADLRHTQGFLAEWDSPDTAHASPLDEHLAAVGGEIAAEVGRQADRLEKELGPWRG